MSCEFGNWSCELGEAVGQWVGGATGQALVAIAEALADGLGQLVRALGTMWIAVPTPTIVENQEISSIGNSTAGVVMMLNWASWLALIVCVLSLIGFGATLGLRRGNERIRRLGSILLRWSWSAVPGRSSATS
jgi:type IV secretion system protein TrbL